MNDFRKIIFLIVIVLFACISCTKDKEENFSVVSCKEYMPMHLGDVQLYRLDSLVPTAFGQSMITKSYIAKDTVVAQRLDAVGDTTFDVSRFVTDTLRSGSWALTTAYQIVYTKNTCDLIQADGKRFIKLSTPVRNGYFWDGNQYFVSGANQSSSDSDWAYYGWNYSYDSVGASYNSAYNVYSNAVIVNEINDLEPFDPDAYIQTQYAQEVYAKGVGLIYRNMLFYMYQGSSNLGSGYDLSSFGIKLTRIQ
ncbi:MAG: hypothetical protein PW786_07460 [Arachidicoccus sp.]|nr:hypothetical protein [Arachidicoccus sp.]